MYTGKVGAGAYGTGECGAAADAAGIIAVVGVAAVPVYLPAVAVPGVIEANRRGWAGVAVPVVASSAADTGGRSKGKDLLVPASVAADPAPAAISKSTRRRRQASGARHSVPNMVVRHVTGLNSGVNS